MLFFYSRYHVKDVCLRCVRVVRSMYGFKRAEAAAAQGARRGLSDRGAAAAPGYVTAASRADIGHRQQAVCSQPGMCMAVYFGSFS
jgi:hypothetical protein